MKQSNSTEIDRLLQRHARRWNAAAPSGRDEKGGGASGSGASQAGAGAHLDADEMSAYAEGALPAAAHARYVAHLADCDSCRKIVAGMMLSGEVEAEAAASTAVREVVPTKPWWSAIAALLAPPVLRYAVPALLLLGIVVVAFVATRNRKEDQLVALNEQKPAGSAVKKEEAPAPTPPGESAVANTSTPTTGANQPAAATDASPSPSDGLIAKNKDVAQTPPAPATTTPTTPSPTGAPGNSPAQGRDLNDQLYENVPKGAPPPPVDQSTAGAKPIAKERDAEEKAAREQNEAAKSSRTETTDLARSKDEGRDNPSIAGGSATGQAKAPQAGERTAAPRTRAARRADSVNADDKNALGSSNETRSVGGRRFRRQGNAWVDIAYKSSRSTINVARGSDQYRSLVADEPTIGKIADQLGGEVILIWMGKAYRIY
jgi:hypothetical protein